MEFISSVRKADSEGDQTQDFSRGNIFAALVFAATLALAPVPTFAQHGGGGGGGGSHGGGGGGSHGGGVGGGSHSAPSSGTHASGAPASSASGASSNSTGSNHWWNPFHGSGTNSSGSNAADHSATDHFAANNNTWQEPPAAGVHGAAVAANAVRGSAAVPRAAIASPPHVPVPLRPVRGGPFFGFN